MGIGNGAHIIIARIRASVGVKMNNICAAVAGWTGSLINSLTPSAIGCRSPNGPTLLGPLRCCI